MRARTRAGFRPPQRAVAPVHAAALALPGCAGRSQARAARAAGSTVVGKSTVTNVDRAAIGIDRAAHRCPAGTASASHICSACATQRDIIAQRAVGQRDQAAAAEDRAQLRALFAAALSKLDAGAQVKVATARVRPQLNAPIGFIAEPASGFRLRFSARTGDELSNRFTGPALKLPSLLR